MSTDVTNLIRQESLTMPEPQRAKSAHELIETDAPAIGRAVLGREPTLDEVDALKSIFHAAAQALRDGLIQRLARYVQAERREETIEGFFEDQVKAD
jgi:hypothetical protein